MVIVEEGDCLEYLKQYPDNSFNCCVTSPPYWGQRRYDANNQHGHEESDEEYIATLTTVFGELRRTLSDTGTFWLNIGDTYYTPRTSNRNGATGKLDRDKVRIRGGGEFEYPKRTSSILTDRCLSGIPWRVALSLISDGWILRGNIIWVKPNPMPDPTSNRPSKKHEHIFLFTKIRSGYTYKKVKPYHHDVWEIPPESCPWHKAIFPLELAKACIAQGCESNGVVFDPYAGSGTTMIAAHRLGCDGIGCEISQEYCRNIRKRFQQEEAYLFT